MNSNSSFSGNFVDNIRVGVAFFMSSHGGHLGTKEVNTEDGPKLVLRAGDGTEVWTSTKAAEAILSGSKKARNLVVGKWKDEESGKEGYTAYFEGGKEIDLSLE